VTAALIAALCVVAAAVCAAADGALLTIDDDASSAELVVRGFLVDREGTHRALAFGRIVLQLGAGAALAQALDVSRHLWLAVGVVLLVVTVSESSARAIGDALGERALYRLAPAVRLVAWALRPVVAVGAWGDAVLLRLLPLRPADESRDADVERFREVVAAEMADGDTGGAGRRLLTGVFALGDTQVQEIMVPRVDIVGVEVDAPWSEVVARVRSTRHARLVVYGEDLDDVHGILYAKDLLDAVLAGEEPEAGWASLVRPAWFIPVTNTVDAQLRDFRQHHRHLALVIDEFGGVAGLVTLEDVLELIVGEIHDEHDSEEDDDEIRSEGDARYWIPAHVTLEALSALTRHDFRRDDLSTVGGLVYELFDGVPEPGEDVEVDGFRVVVEQMRGRRVQRVYFERLSASGGGDA
jgi:putative hemolysin